MFMTSLSRANIYIYGVSSGIPLLEKVSTLRGNQDLKNISKWMEQMEVRMQETPGGSEGSAK